jgi:uncharacterized protein (DUF433 family)
MVVSQIGAGLTIDQLPADYPNLDRDEVPEGLHDARGNGKPLQPG